MSTVTNLAEWRAKKNKIGSMTFDELAEQTVRLDNLRSDLMDALFDIKATVADGAGLPIVDDLVEMRAAIEAAMAAAAAIADHFDNELERRIRSQ